MELAVSPGVRVAADCGGLLMVRLKDLAAREVA
jgi:hypothetical protein